MKKLARRLGASLLRAMSLDSASLGDSSARMRVLIIPALIVLSLLAENLHGILTRMAGYEAYAPITVSEFVRGGMFLAFILYALLHLEDGLSRLALAAFGVLVALTCIQSVFTPTGFREIAATLSRGSRWLFLFFALAYFTGEIRRARLPAETAIAWVRWGIVLFFSAPILLSALGIAGYRVYDESRGGFAGFILSNNTIASIFVFTSPLYFARLGRWRDRFLLAVFLLGAVLLGSRAVYGGIGVVAGGWALIQGYHYLRVYRSRALPLLGLSVAGALVLAGLVAISPLGGRIGEIYQSQTAIYQYFLSGQYIGVQASPLDVLTNFRTNRVTRLLDWMDDPDNIDQFILGGGSQTYLQLYGEINWIDLIALYGLLGVVLFYGLLLWLSHVLWQNRSTPWRRAATLTMVLAILVSLAAGHTFDDPVATFLLAAAIAPVCCWWVAEPESAVDRAFGARPLAGA